MSGLAPESKSSGQGYATPCINNCWLRRGKYCHLLFASDTRCSFDQVANGSRESMVAIGKHPSVAGREEAWGLRCNRLLLRRGVQPRLRPSHSLQRKRGVHA